MADNMRIKIVHSNGSQITWKRKYSYCSEGWDNMEKKNIMDKVHDLLMGKKFDCAILGAFMSV